VAEGSYSLSHNSSGNADTAVGYESLYNNTIGYDSTAIGGGALGNETTGGNNIGIGYQAGGEVTTGSNNIEIGNAGASSDNNVIRIGVQGVQTATEVGGIYSETVQDTGTEVFVDANGKLGTIVGGNSAASIGNMRKAIAALQAANEKLQAGNTRLQENNDSLKATVDGQAKTLGQLQMDFQATVARQQQEIKDLTAGLKEQASLLQKVALRNETAKSASRIAVNNN
jgi:hypothetical protein